MSQEYLLALTSYQNKRERILLRYLYPSVIEKTKIEFDKFFNKLSDLISIEIDDEEFKDRLLGYLIDLVWNKILLNNDIVINEDETISHRCIDELYILKESISEVFSVLYMIIELFEKSKSANDKIDEDINQLVYGYLALHPQAKSLLRYKEAIKGTSFELMIQRNLRKLISYDKKDYVRDRLYKKAYELYKEHYGKDDTYTYVRSLKDANGKYKLLDDDKFNIDKDNIEQGYKYWRKNRKD